MAASKHSEERQRAGHAAGLRPDMRPVEALLDHGARLRLSSPELALVFGERAAGLAEAGGSEELWVRAEALAVFAHIRLGQRAAVVDRAMAALRAAEAGGYRDLSAVLRTDLALCARSVGTPLTGLAALRPVLSGSEVRPAVRAAALVQLVSCMTTLGRREVLDRALTEADNLVSADPDLPSDSRTLLRVMVRTRTTAHLRRNGDIAAAMQSAERGLDLLGRLSNPAADGAELRTRLGLELVCALLDRGSIDDAAALAKSLLDRPARAAAVAPLCWLRLAVATRILLPAGSAEAAAALVRDALYFAGRHGLPALTARLWLELAHIEERLGRAHEAVRCLHEARAEDHRYARVKRQATSLLTGEFGRGEQPAVDLHKLLGAARTAPVRKVPAQRMLSNSARVEPVFPEPSAVPQPTIQLPVVPSTVEVPSREEPAAQTTPAPARVLAEQSTAAGSASARRHAETAPTARSVLERLGVTVGSGGRRRAARHAGEAEFAPRHGQPDQHRESAGQPESQDLSTHTETAQRAPAQETAPTVEPILLPRLKLPDTLEPEALRLVTGVADADEETGRVRDTDAVEDLQPEEAPRRALQPQELNSLLAVFSNWTGDEQEPTDIGTLARRRWPERSRPGVPAIDPGAAHGQVVNGENPVRGRHHGEG